jgi:integrase/recombinase XerD
MKISKAIAIYVEHKRAGGLYYLKTAETLDSFSRLTGNMQLACITKSRISEFLNGARKASIGTWVAKYGILRAFFKYWKFRGHVKVLRMPPPRRGGTPKFIPFIYTPAELRRLLKSTVLSQRGHRPTSVDPFTFRTLIRFLYGTGVLVEEMLTLCRDDVNLEENMITLRRPNVGTSRRIPIGLRVRSVLLDYLNSPVRRRSNDQRFFVSRGGRPIGYRAICTSFRRLRRYAKVTRLDAGDHPPRIRDLRFTFIVHRLTSWFREGVSVESMLPALAEYLGEVDLRSMERYLELTPQHFRKQLRKLKLRAPSLTLTTARSGHSSLVPGNGALRSNPLGR